MINSKKITIASVFSAGLLWVLCSLLVVLFPNSMMQITAHMLHADLPHISWTLTWSGFLIGLIGWVVLAGAMGSLVSVIYNRLICNEN